MVPCLAVKLIFCPHKLILIIIKPSINKNTLFFVTCSAFILFVDSTSIKKMNMDGTEVETIHRSGGFTILALDYHHRLVGHVGFAYASKRTQIRKS